MEMVRFGLRKTESLGKMDKQEKSIASSLCPSGWDSETGPLVSPT